MKKRDLASDVVSAEAAKVAAEAAKVAAAEAAASAAETARRVLAAASMPPTPISETQARAWATEVEPTAKNDPDRFRGLFRQKIRSAASAEYLLGGPAEFQGPFVVHISPALVIDISGPIAKFEWSFSERIRQFKSTAGILWSPNVTVHVVPLEIGAPSIQTIVLQRNGVTVPQIGNTLRPVPLTTRLGATESIFQGEVTYPSAAFLPAADLDLKLTAVPVSGSNIVKVFSNRQLQIIR
jgi:hypothetical protein